VCIQLSHLLTQTVVHFNHLNLTKGKIKFILGFFVNKRYCAWP